MSSSRADDGSTVSHIRDIALFAIEKGDDAARPRFVHLPHVGLIQVGLLALLKTTSNSLLHLQRETRLLEFYVRYLETKE